MIQYSIRALLTILAFFIMSTSQSSPSSPSAEQWQSLKQWLESNYQEHLRLLNPPANQAILKQAEDDLGYLLPGQLVEILIINDGETTDSKGLFGTRRLMSVTEQVAAYKFLRGDKRFPEKQLHPFLESGGGDYYCVDLSNGKIIEWWHEGGNNGEISASVTEFLKAFNRSLVDGNYVIIEGLAGLVDKGDL